MRGKNGTQIYLICLILYQENQVNLRPISEVA